MKLLLLISAFVFTCLVDAIHNVTIDDTDTSMIIYSGTWDSDNFQMSPLDYGGSHTVSTVGEDPNAFATFTFVGTHVINCVYFCCDLFSPILSPGVAIYYMSPKWPFQISVAISLDGGNSTTVDLRDYSKPLAPNNSTETVQSQSVWSSTTLTNETHSVVVSRGNGSTYVVVDGFK